MIRLILFLLIPLATFGQGRVWQRCGAPVNIPTKFLVNIDIMSDTCNGVTYKITDGKWTINNGLGKSMGVVPGPAGPKGDPGVCPPCPGGSGVFPFIVVVGTGDDDVQIKNAFEQQRTTRKKIVLIGDIVTSQIDIARDQYECVVEGYGALWKFRPSAPYGIKRILPPSVTESMLDVRARVIWEGVKFEAAPHQIVLDLGASENNRYQDLKFSYAKTAIHLRFSLRTTIDNCEAVTCVNGFIVDIGNWPGATYTSSNAQSNQVLITNSRIVYSSTGSGEVGIGVYGCSGVVLDNNIIEGAKYKKSIDKDFKMCPNDKDFTVRNLHNEPVLGNLGAGSGEAYIYIRMVGVANIDGVYSQYGGCFIDAGGSPAELTIHVQHISWLVLDKNQKLFNNGGGSKFQFSNNSYQSLLVPDKQTDPTKPNYGGFLSGAELSRLFTGTPTTLYTGSTATQPPNTFILQ